MNIVIYALIFFSFIFSNIKTFNDFPDNWSKIQNDNIKIETQMIDDKPYCRATGSFNFPSNKIVDILRDQVSYPNIFERIISTKMITDYIVYVEIDLPFPFKNRDYIVEYNYFKDGQIEYFYYKATNKHNIPINNDFIRLLNTSGIWKITSLNDNQTELTYIWQGELMGDFPDWALKTAWIEQGNEVFLSIKNYLKD